MPEFVSVAEVVGNDEGKVGVYKNIHPSAKGRGAERMDADRARQLAVARFSEAALKDLDGWEIRGPREEDVTTLAGVKACLIYDFVPRTDENQPDHRFKLSVAVDPDTGTADMLR